MSDPDASEASPARRRRYILGRDAWRADPPDDGCDLHPACLTCPFPRCRYDYQGGLNGLRAAVLAERARELRAGGSTVAQAADELGISRRTVIRAGASPAASDGHT